MMDKQKFLRISLPIMILGSLMDCFSTILGLRVGLRELNPIASILISFHPILLFVFDALIILFILKFVIYIYYDSYKEGDYTNIFFELLPLTMFGLGKMLLGCYNISLLL